ncbi:nuclear pore complex protein Nup98-Nup96 [Achroia grisella]|uniref:nuclear pore complex protein Nup98-Nup96 n=1 Tax=Achroia grisella TaxID=688607 RepID=UPI0027D2E6A0|nr:nuclear pore complex protein Nup98-Nup96 [Achroia grisella]
MFQKPAFGSNTSGFGSFNAGASTSTFGGFKPTTGTSAFGAPPAFGAAAATQPTTGGGLFGASNTSTSLFGSSNTATTAPAFGASTSGFGFGANTSTGGLFGSNNTSTGLFGATQNNSAFGAKPAGGFGFGSTATTGTTGGGLFGSTAGATTGLFGQQNTTLGGGGLFTNNTGGFGQQPAGAGTAHVKYNPVVGTDVVVKSGTSQSILIKHHCITCMKEYESKSLEELRLEDYTAGRKGATGGVFGGFQNTMENKPLFGANTSFGQPATTSAPSVFGGGGIVSGGGFGQTPGTFSFGSNTQNNTASTGLFGAAKPAFGTTATTGTGLFGATTTQAPSFGTNTSTFGFGSTTQNQQSTGLFGAKPATTGFGTTPANTGFSGFGNTSLFGAKPQQTTAPAFGSTAPAFGGLSTGFGTATSTAGGGLFSNVSFGKPANSQPAFGFNTQPNTLGLGAGAAPFGAKPPAPAFGALGGGVFPQNNTSFRTGLDSGLGGGGLFNTSLGGSGLGLGLHANNTGLLNSASGQNVHEQMLTLAARPYGDSPLFKDLLPDTSTGEEALRPTNPAALRAALGVGAAAYRVSAAAPRHALATRAHHHKKSLFEGLEESDASLEDKLSLKPSRKRLVLRQNKSDGVQNDSVDHLASNRSLEEPSAQPETNGAPVEPERDHVDSERSRVRRADLQNNDVDVNTDRHGSWLSSPKVSWTDNEKGVDESTPRLYPSLDKELNLNSQVAERRASWLTTKPLRKPLVSNPDSAENSVRELGVRTDRQNDKENIDTLSVSEEENVSAREVTPHPAGVKLTRPGYYTIPSLDEITGYLRSDGSCVVPHLTIGRKNYGNVYYDCEIDVAGLDLDSLVHFLNKEVIVYPEDSDKPPEGEGLNRRAVVTLDRVWPRDKTQSRPITDPDRLLKMDYEAKLRRVCDKHDTKFIEYRPQTGSWVFRVEHFSKYGLTDSDEEDDITPEVLKRQLVNQQSLQTAVPIPKTSVPVSGGSAPAPAAGLGLSHGLGDDLFAMHQTSLDLLNGAGKAFEMDTTEDNAEAQSLYQDSKAYGMKSPTGELARLEHRQSHNVQLMKASLYADMEMDDDVSVSTGDQLVPLAAPRLIPSPVPITPAALEMDLTPTPADSEEVTMKPLIVRPYTIVLQYHRKVPPFKETIAGKLDAACLADMSVCRARHSRIGFGPAGTLAYVATHRGLHHLPRSAQMSELSQYVVGRSHDDWSEPLLARLALGTGDAGYMQESLTRHLATLLEWSEPVPEPGPGRAAAPDRCPQLRVKTGARDRRRLLQQQLKDAAALKNYTVQFGVSGAYCYEVWKLCEALWGDDLENDGVPGNDVQSIVNRHKKLLEWFAEAVGEITDKELSKTTEAEAMDESDGHSRQVWSLVVAGRLLQACQLCVEKGDLNMAALISQAAGDPSFRSLVGRQLSLWRECGADGTISEWRLATLRLVAGRAGIHELRELDWLRALHATARYLSPQVPTLDKVIATYESFFKKGEADDEPVDLSTLEQDEMGMKFPLPPYYGEYEFTSKSGGGRRVVDLRYSLVRARSCQARPALQPAAAGPHPLDYTLCFLLGTWFGNPTIESITGIADQLEACGLWHLAIQALAYHPNDIARGHLIRGVLGRHAPARVDGDDAEDAERLRLVRALQVPETWLRSAQAHRAHYMHLPAVEVEHLIAAEQWNAAHRVLLDELLPDAILSDNIQSIAPLLEKLNEAASRHEVSGWETGGLALYHYWHVCNEIRGLVSTEGGGGAGDEDAETEARLEALRPRINAACRALAALQPKCAREAMARAEMGARLVQVAAAARLPARRLAALLRSLRLPPDCGAHVLRQITTDLAEQASELCIESVSSSPLSSHHRATVQS